MTSEDDENALINQSVKEDSDLGRVSAESRTLLNRYQEVRRHARAMIARGERVTIAAIRTHVSGLGRGYSLKTDQISAALALLYRTGELERYSNGQRVKVGRKIYRSIRAAAEANAVSPNTVRKWAASKRPEFRGWKYLD